MMIEKARAMADLFRLLCRLKILDHHQADALIDDLTVRVLQYEVDGRSALKEDLIVLGDDLGDV